jgi:hypothetical protein
MNSLFWDIHVPLHSLVEAYHLSEERTASIYTAKNKPRKQESIFKKSVLFIVTVEEITNLTYIKWFGRQNTHAQWRTLRI